MSRLPWQFDTPRFLVASDADECDVDPTPDPDLTATVAEEMDAGEDAEQGLVARRRAKRVVKIRTRRKA